MCLYPKLIKNKKYIPNKKNNWDPPKIKDYRTAYVTAACGKCLECRKQKQRAWLVRMSEELRNEPNAYFMTLTFAQEHYENIKYKYNIEDENEIATKAIRLTLERIRKKTKKSIKHWFITELGHTNTERLHLHGIIWGIGTDKLIKETWKYGLTFTGTYVNEKTIQYITKYITKIDEDHKKFQGKVLCSAGIGSNYINRGDAAKHIYKEGETIETYRLRNGAKINLPIYYRNKIFTEDEREKLFIDKIKKGDIYVMGQKVKIEDTEYYKELIEQARKDANRIHGDIEREWEEQKYIKRLKRQIKKQNEAIQELTDRFYTTEKECPF